MAAVPEPQSNGQAIAPSIDSLNQKDASDRLHLQRPSPSSAGPRPQLLTQPAAQSSRNLGPP
ncbi:hypothetical protein ACQ4M4_09920 [Leptolyngbya sp. AN02str]|uniref:hypothetical protein n=1 Tax=Leptolyngbya sp. AN02str TaxID=3423363 RepID=UPI003D3210CF